MRNIYYYIKKLLINWEAQFFIYIYIYIIFHTDLRHILSFIQDVSYNINNCRNIETYHSRTNNAITIRISFEWSVTKCQTIKKYSLHCCSNAHNQHISGLGIFLCRCNIAFTYLYRYWYCACRADNEADGRIAFDA